MKKSLLQGMLIPVMLVLAACGSDGTDTDATAAAKSPQAGARVFAACGACHTRTPGAPHKFGPNLHNLIGRKAGTAEGFAYSPALRDSGIVWNAQTLDEYLAAPTRRVPGTRMTLATHDPSLRQAIIQYLSAPTP
ncbi:MAG: c-type cytochrome [Rhodanobacter sp.]